jgi:hypothetical protein
MTDAEVIASAYEAEFGALFQQTFRNAVDSRDEATAASRFAKGLTLLRGAASAPPPLSMRPT